MITFEKELSLTQFRIPPICVGILLGGFILYLYIYLKYRNRLFLSIILLSFLALIFVGSETMIVTFGGWLHNRAVSIQFHRSEQLAGLFYLFALPYYLVYLLELNKKWQKANKIIAFIGLGIAIIISSIFFFLTIFLISCLCPKTGTPLILIPAFLILSSINPIGL